MWPRRNQTMSISWKKWIDWLKLASEVRKHAMLDRKYEILDFSATIFRLKSVELETKRLPITFILDLVNE